MYMYMYTLFGTVWLGYTRLMAIFFFSGKFLEDVATREELVVDKHISDLPTIFII